jgi:serine/threonine protein kinase
MELMPINLERHIKEQLKVSCGCQVTLQVVVNIMLQIALGMEYLHGQDVVHRNLKPNNILVCPNTNPKLSIDGYAEVKLADCGFGKNKVQYLSINVVIQDLWNSSMEGTRGFWGKLFCKKG